MSKFTICIVTIVTSLIFLNYQFWFSVFNFQTGIVFINHFHATNYYDFG